MDYRCVVPHSVNQFDLFKRGLLAFCTIIQLVLVALVPP